MGFRPTISTQSLPPANPAGSGSTGDLLRRSGWPRFAVPLLALAVVSTLAGFEVARHSPSKWASADLVQAATLPVNAAIAPAQPLSLEAISRLVPQSQAEQLLERAIARVFESLDALNQ